MNAPERQEWSTLAPPVYAQPRRVEVAYRLEMPGVTGARVTCFGLDGDVLVSVWDVSLAAARTEAQRCAAKLASIAGKHPEGVPFDREAAR